MKYGISIIIIAAVAIGGYLIITKTPKTDTVVDDTSEATSGATTSDTPMETPTTDTVKIEIITPGTGAEVKAGDTIKVMYTGSFPDGKKFDSNIDPAFKHSDPLSVKVGAGMVIKGWDQGLLGMKVGEKRKLTIPPSLGYGPNDYGPIPGNSTLVFEVELLSIN